jgi:hypothetical protein
VPARNQIGPLCPVLQSAVSNCGLAVTGIEKTHSHHAAANLDPAGRTLGALVPPARALRPAKQSAPTNAGSMRPGNGDFRLYACEFFIFSFLSAQIIVQGLLCFDLSLSSARQPGCGPLKLILVEPASLEAALASISTEPKVVQDYGIFAP